MGDASREQGAGGEHSAAMESPKANATASTKLDPEELLRQLSYTFASGGESAKAMFEAIQKYSASYQAAKEAEAADAAQHVKREDPVGDEKPQAATEMTASASLSPPTTSGEEQQEDTEQGPRQLPEAAIQALLNARLQQTQRQLQAWQEHYKSTALSEDRQQPAYQHGHYPPMPPQLPAFHGMHGFPPPGGPPPGFANFAYPPYHQFYPGYPHPLANTSGGQPGQPGQPGKLAESDVDSKEAAMCLLAIERGEEKTGSMTTTATRNNNNYNNNNNNNKSRGPYLLAGRKKRGRPPKHPVDGNAPEESGKKQVRVKSCAYIGVRRRKWGTYASEIRNPLSGSREWLGTFDTPEEAAVVYDIRLRMIRGPDATRVNFPPLNTHDVMLTRVISPYGASRPEREHVYIPFDWMHQVLRIKAERGTLDSEEVELVKSSATLGLALLGNVDVGGGNGDERWDGSQEEAPAVKGEEPGVQEEEEDGVQEEPAAEEDWQV